MEDHITEHVAAKKPLRAPAYFCNPGPLRSIVFHFFCNAHSPLHTVFGSLRSDNKVKIQN